MKQNKTTTKDKKMLLIWIILFFSAITLIVNLFDWEYYQEKEIVLLYPHNILGDKLNRAEIIENNQQAFCTKGFITELNLLGKKILNTMDGECVYEQMVEKKRLVYVGIGTKRND